MDDNFFVVLMFIALAGLLLVGIAAVASTPDNRVQQFRTTCNQDLGGKVRDNGFNLICIKNGHILDHAKSN